MQATMPRPRSNSVTQPMPMSDVALTGETLPAVPEALALGEPHDWSTPEAMADSWMRYAAQLDPCRPIGNRGRTAPEPATVAGFAAFANKSYDTFYTRRRGERGEGLRDMARLIDGKIKASLTGAALTGGVAERLATLMVTEGDQTNAVGPTVGASSEAYEWDQLCDDEMTILQHLLGKATAQGSAMESAAVAAMEALINANTTC